MNYERQNINQTMFDFILQAKGDKQYDAIVYGRRRISFSAFHKMVDKCAARFCAVGVKKGDCVAICLPNIPQAEIALYACCRIGAIANMVHPKTSPSEFQKLVELTKPKVALLTEINYFSYRPYLKRVKKVFCSLVLARGFFGLIKRNKNFEVHHSDGNDVAIYMHSGGTTGASKTAVLSHRAFNSLADNLLLSINNPFSANDLMLAVLPMFHGFGLAAGIHLPLIAGMPSALMPIFSSKKVVKLIKRHNMNTLSLIPRMMQKLLDEPLFTDEVASRLKYLYVGGDNLSDKLRIDFDEKLKKSGSTCVVQQGYGLTELGSICALNFSKPRDSSVGQPLLGTEAIIVDEDMKEVPKGEVGELLYHCKQFMDGYLGDKEATKNTFVEIDGKVWLRTGDYMSMDQDGYLFFRDRKKRLIKISGMNAFPLEIENTAKELPEISNCVATQKLVGIKPYICLYVVLRDDINL